MAHITHKLVRNIKIKLTKEGRQEYYGTSKCTEPMIAIPHEEYFKVQGRTLIQNGACPVLINSEEFYLFEANEVEVI